jgi:large subunit ribosomal protein L13
VYKRYSGYPGGLRQRTMEEQMATDPTQIIRHAVKGMLPHNSLGQQLCAHVHIYAGSAHPHQSQQPTPIQVTRLGVEGLRA